MSPFCSHCQEGGALSRRGFLSFGGALAAGLAADPACVFAAETDPSAEVLDEQAEWGDTPVLLNEGTNLAIALSPDGRSLAMDLQ
ncbi:MAG: hypothetical protein ABW067_13815, partial [Rhizobacter sp.]